MRSPGQSMTEYGLIAALIGVVALSGLLLLSGNINQAFAGLFGGRPAGGAQMQTGNGPAANGGPVVRLTARQIQERVERTLQASYDPSTGEIVYPVWTPNGVATQRRGHRGHQRQ